MPVWKARYDHTKVYRPDGMLYSSAKAVDLQEAILEAERAFREEHGRDPEQGATVIEAVGVTAGWGVFLFEIQEHRLGRGGA